MRQWFIGFAVIVVLAVAVASCTKKDPDGTPTEEFSGYKSWTRVNKETITGDASRSLGRAHEGARGFRQIHVNSVGETVATSVSGYPYPEGTIIVKESRKTEGGDLENLSVMVKRGSDYDPENGNWEYIMTSPSLKVASQGKVGMCIGCHTSAFDHDYTFNDTYAQ